MTIGSRIKARREEVGLSVADLATRTGVSPSAVYQWESGDTKGLRPANLVAVAEALKTTEKWLATSKGQKERNKRHSLDDEEEEVLANYAALTPDAQDAIRATLRNLAAEQRKRDAGNEKK